MNETIKLNYTLDEQNHITSVVIIPFDESKPNVECSEDDYDKIVLYATKVIDGKLDFSENADYIELRQLRARREEECFSIINRGALWYQHLTTEKIEELNVWYEAWLDVTETRIVPERPEWL